MSSVEEPERSSNSTELIFKPNAPQDEPLDEEKVLFSIYNEINPGKKKTKVDEEWSLQMTCIVEWFIRCSWINKFFFLDMVCYETKGSYVLENVLKTIEYIVSKDVLESLSNESTNFCYDRIPTDDNRALEPVELNRVMKDAFVWCLNQDPGTQVLIILKLLRLGGGGLIYKIYKAAEKYYKDRQPIETSLSCFSLDRSWRSKQKVRDGSKSRLSMQNSDTKSFEIENRVLSKFALKKQEQLERREAEFVNYKKLKGILEEDCKKLKKGEMKETVDYLQILPIRLNRRIMSYIDDKTLGELKKVGKYWGKMIDESINEKSGRKAINAKINKMTGIKGDKEEKKNGEKREEIEEMEEREVEFVVEMGPKDFINKKNENEVALTATSEWFEEIFSRKCITQCLDSSFYSDRCGAYDSTIGTFACSTANNTILFYSARSGARLSYLVFGLELSVTCLNLHENRIHVFIGFKDGKLLSKDIRTNKTTLVFTGHSDSVRSIFTTSSNLLSSSLDNTIKYFRLWSGVCLLCIDLNPDLGISSLLQRNDKPSWAAIGTREGVLVLVDVEGKKFLSKVKLHADEITSLAHDGDFLITGTSTGIIRVWYMPELNKNSVILRPYYDIEVESSVLALKFYNNQIFSGCESGTVKIISLATGKVFKTLKISSQTPITGVEITEDKLFMKLIIWHEKGIEIRTFSLQKSSSKKISKGKDNQDCKQKAPKETKKNKMSEISWSDCIRPKEGMNQGTPRSVKRIMTFANSKTPLRQRCCTLPSLRTGHKPIWEFNKSLFTEVHNITHSNANDLEMYTFPRLKNINQTNALKKQKR